MATNMIPGWKMEEYREVFQMFDKNGDDRIGLSELRSALSLNGEKVTEQEARRLMKELDVKEPGNIRLEEFAALLDRRLGRMTLEEELREAFNFFDKGREGYITGKALWDGLRSLEEGVTPEHVRELIRAADVDADGKVSFRDFATFFSRTQQERDAS